MTSDGKANWQTMSLGIYGTGLTYNTGTFSLDLDGPNGVLDTVNLSSLASDVVVTGGTYDINTGTATFTNVTGGTFNVTGFLVGYTDLYVSGGTYSNGTITFTNTSGGTFQVTGLTTGSTTTISGEYLPLSGGTVTGNTIFTQGLTANTISASTYLGNIVTSISTVSGLSANTTTGNVLITNTSPDQTVTISGGTGITTGGTYPNFTLVNSSPDQTVTISGGTGISTGGSYPNFTLVNSAPDQIVTISGGTYTNIAGSYPNFNISITGVSSADTFVTGFSYSNNTFTINRNQGQQNLTATINTVTGLTINGNLTATTISATTYQNLSNNLTGLYLPLSGGTVSGNTTFTQNMTVSNNVGIGTTLPTARLTISGGSNSGVARYGEVFSTYNGITLNGSTGQTDYNFISSSGDTTLFINRPSARNISFRENNSEQMVIQASTGNVGIGVGSPSEKLEVSGKTKTINLQLTSGATTGYVLTSLDNNGNTTWSPASGLTGTIKKYSQTLTTPSAGTTTITHNLGTTDIQVSLWLVTTGDLTTARVTNRLTNSVNIVFSSPPGEDVRVVIIG